MMTGPATTGGKNRGERGTPPVRMIARAGAALALGAGAALGPGCASPLYRENDNDLRKSVMDSARRELEEAERSRGPVTVPQAPRPDVLGLKPEILAELERMSGPSSYRGIDPPLGASLIDVQAHGKAITLERVIQSTAANNLTIEFDRINPAIAESRTIQAEAAFDWVFFSSANWNSQDEPQIQSSFVGTPNGPIGNQRQAVDMTAGVRRQLTTGGKFTVQTGFTYTDVASEGLNTFPHPSYEPTVVLQLDQPLLRNFGSAVALSQVRLNKNAERDEIEKLRGDLIGQLRDGEQAYWNLARAYADLLILQRLLEQGIKTRDVLRNRGPFVKQAQIADAEARVEQRRSNVIRAQRSLQQASDQLKRAMNDPELPVGGQALLLPADAPVSEAFNMSLADAGLTAMANRPEVARAILSIDDTSIRQEVADNARLPQLNFRAQTKFSGLGDDTDSSYDNLTDASFVSFLVGLDFEQPIGNRAAEAGFRQRRLERTQAVTAYRNTAQGVMSEVVDAMRDVLTNYALIGQTRQQRVAAAENVRSLEVEEQLLQALTVEFLNLKFQRQEQLAQSEQDEIQALIDYNNALNKLSAATGTTLKRNRIAFTVPDVAQTDPSAAFYPVYPWTLTPGELKKPAAGEPDPAQPGSPGQPDASPPPPQDPTAQPPQ
jgi:outer membrane protein